MEEVRKVPHDGISVLIRKQRLEPHPSPTPTSPPDVRMPREGGHLLAQHSSEPDCAGFLISDF